MNVQIIAASTLSDGTSRFQIRVSDKDKIFFGYILEALDGWCNYTTPQNDENVLQVDVVPDFTEEFHAVFAEIQKWESNGKTD